MSCECDYEPADLWFERQPRAAKAHRCCECHGLIAKGERHGLATGKYDGQWFSNRRCADCQHHACTLGKLESHCICCQIWGGLQEEIARAISEDLPGPSGPEDPLIQASYAFIATAKARGGSATAISSALDDLKELWADNAI